MIVYDDALGACRATTIGAPASYGRVLIVGEINPYGADPAYALYHQPDGCAGHRLQSRIMGLLPVDYLSMWRTNLCMSMWDVGEARDCAGVLYGSVAPWDTIIMLGRQVESAFRFHTGRKAAAFESYAAVRPPGPSAGSVTLLSLHHPSARNTQSATPEAVASARKALALVAPEIPWGSA